MKKFIVRGMYTEYIYAETTEEAMELFDKLVDPFIIEPFDEIECEEMPLSVEK